MATSGTHSLGNDDRSRLWDGANQIVSAHNPAPMGRRAISDLQRAKLIEAFRADAEAGTPSSFRRAALAADVDARTAKRAWERGWPPMKPIREMIELEKSLARAALRKEVLAQRLDEAQRLAAEDASESRAMAGKTVRAINTAARSAILALHEEQTHLYMRRLAQLFQNEDPTDAKATAARQAFLDLAMVIRRLAQAAHTGMEMERLILGEPTTILGGEIGIRPVIAPNATAEEIAIEAQAAMRAVAELRELEAPKTETETNDGGTPDLAN
jgi:hypothetical protein